MITPNLEAYLAMVNALNLLRRHKPGVAPDKGRFYAVVVTEQEKVTAYMKTFVLTLDELNAAAQGEAHETQTTNRSVE